MNVSGIFIEEFVKILLTIVLAINVGMFKFIWNRHVEEKKERKENRELIEQNRDSIMKVFDRTFGMSEDPTSEGYLVETEDQFQQTSKQLEKISEQIEQLDRRRKEEHREVREQLEKLIVELSTEEEIDLDLNDFDI